MENMTYKYKNRYEWNMLTKTFEYITHLYTKSLIRKANKHVSRYL